MPCIILKFYNPVNSDLLFVFPRNILFIYTKAQSSWISINHPHQETWPHV